MDRIIAESGVAKMTLYRNFASKDELILAFLERREERWTRDWLQAEVERRATAPAERMLAIFDVFGEWFATEDFEGCSFINVMLEVPVAGHPVREACVRHLAGIRAFVAGLAEEAGIADPDAVARQWHILMKGCIVAAGEGDGEAGARARELGALLLERTASRCARRVQRGVERLEQGTQPAHLARAERGVQVAVVLADQVARDRVDVAAAVRGAHELRAAVGRVGHALDVAVALQVRDELGHRLLGDARPLGEHADARARVVEVLEDEAVRRPDLLVAGGGEPVDEHVVDDAQRLAQQDGQVLGPAPGAGVGKAA